MNPEPDETGQKDRKKGILIVGNMSVGKSALFSRMCGGKATKVKVAGNTVLVRTGHIRGTDKDVFDTPGIFSIFSNNEDERTSKDILLPQTTENFIHGIVLVADAKNLKRSIAIALQYAEYGLPMLLAINMIDETAPRGIEINTEKLSEALGIDVSTVVAREGIGVKKVVSKLAHMKTAHKMVEYPDWIEDYLEIVAKVLKASDVSTRAVGLLLLTGDSGVEQFIEKKFGTGMLTQQRNLVEKYRREEPQICSMLLTNLYYKKASHIIDEVQKVHPPSRNPFLVRFGDWCTQFSTGIPIAFAMLCAMYLFVGSFGATFLVDTINKTFFEGFLLPWTTKLVAPIPSVFLRDMIVDPDFGILPTGVFLALGLVLPVLFCFYVAFGILKDSGYLPRVSILLDKLFQKMGLNGKGVIPLVMGFSCITMAILTTRMLDTKKEKNIATFLLLLGVPCAPLLAVMFIILGKMPVSATITVFGLIFLQILVAGFFANKILPGSRTPLFMEIPPMRFPKPFQVLKMSAVKTYFFMKEAVPIFILASLLVFLFERTGGLMVLERISEPVISGFMGLPEKSVQVFIKTIIRRESGATEIEHLSGIYDNVQLVVNLLVMTFLLPCMNATIVLFKERGSKTALLIMGTVMIYAILIGSALNHICRMLGVTFT
ncbi:MAG: ferrous iron transporter B [Deltaproteobacteria bacterium]|nr:ferrous iron transporter B [Deltaproteobacteria bacterium]